MKTPLLPALLAALLMSPSAPATAAEPSLKIGLIGLDTSHAIAFTKELNSEKPAPELAGCKVIVAYPKGSEDIESSVSRIPKYTEDVKKLGVEIAPSIDALLKQVDCVLLETNDGRPHLAQALACFQAGKPTFIDKPIAGSLADAIAIFEASKRYNCPTFSSSSLRYGKQTQAVHNGSIGKVTKAETTSPASIDKTHPDLFWYGIHGVETLFAVMGTGCESVTRTSTPGTDHVTGTWKGGRIGTFRGLRAGKAGYGATAFGDKGIEATPLSGSYEPLVVEICKFFRGGKPPVSLDETVEILAFMEAADESMRQNGAPVTLESVLSKARKRSGN